MAIIGKGRPTPVHWLRTGMMQSRRVGRVRSDHVLGSGFFVDGVTFDARFIGVPLFVTTQHMFNPIESWAGASVVFDGLVDDPAAQHVCNFRRVLWSSPVDALDAIVLVLDRIPGNIDDFVVSPACPSVNDPVFIFGYPRGGGMMFSQLDNLVLGEDGHELLYLAPTEPGSSGSPVFNEHWEAVAMHRRWSTEPDGRRANRGIKLTSILGVLQSVASTLEPDGADIPKPPAQVERPEYYSVFISYSHADKSFARRLMNDLQSRGIRCWLDEHQIRPGDDIYEQVDRGIKLWDKTLLCCSRSSLTSWWVDNEIDSSYQKEQRLMKERGKKVLAVVPLDLDGFLFDGWSSGKAVQLRSRLAADFKDWQANPQKYDASLDLLVLALRADAGARETPPEPRL